jgi:hypothetical protein
MATTNDPAAASRNTGADRNSNDVCVLRWAGPANEDLLDAACASFLAPLVSPTTKTQRAIIWTKGHYVSDARLGPRP